MRVELNAFTSRELLDLIERSVSGPKVVPRNLQDFYAEASIRKRVAEFEQGIRAEEKPKAPCGLRDTIAEMLQDDPTLSWDEALGKLV